MKSEHIQYCVPESYYQINKDANINFCLSYNRIADKCFRCDPTRVLSNLGECTETCEANEVVQFQNYNVKLDENDEIVDY